MRSTPSPDETPVPDVGFLELLDRLQADEPAAANRIFQEYAGRLIALASQRLDSLVLRKIEPADIVQSVFKSFFVRQRATPFVLGDWEDLWSVLAVLTVRKCHEKRRYFTAARRDAQRELAPRSADHSGFLGRAIAPEPDPAEAVVLVETVERLFRLFPERDQAILQLRLQGYDVAEISAQLDCTQRKVYRVLEQVKRELQRMRDENPPRD
jgi:RNA polymerase sigma-70 factor (ECF subfamily)